MKKIIWTLVCILAFIILIFYSIITYKNNIELKSDNQALKLENNKLEYEVKRYNADKLQAIDFIKNLWYSYDSYIDWEFAIIKTKNKVKISLYQGIVELSNINRTFWKVAYDHNKIFIAWYDKTWCNHIESVDRKNLSTILLATKCYGPNGWLLPGNEPTHMFYDLVPNWNYLEYKHWKYFWEKGFPYLPKDNEKDIVQKILIK